MLHSFVPGTLANRPNTFLTDDELRIKAPSIFAEAKHSSRSERYSYIPTSVVVDGLRKEGFAPVKVMVSRVRDGDKLGFEKHLIRFRPLDSISKVGEVHPEVILINSHDGSTSYKLSAGLFRLVCSNGLVIPQGEVDEVRIKHTGRNIVLEVVEASYKILGQSVTGIETASRWGQLQLTDGEQMALAVGAHHVRFADAHGVIETPIKPEQLLRSRRSYDSKNDLWSTFNRIQENVIKGGLRDIAVNADGRRRTREVKGIDGYVNLNKAIWKMAEHLAGLKGSN